MTVQFYLAVLSPFMVLAATTSSGTQAPPGATSSTQPASDLVARNFGAEAAASLELTITANAPCSAGRGGSTAEPPCFALSESPEGKVAVTGSSMDALTYGIGYYTRFSCGLTVGWARGGGSFTSSSAWPCHNRPLKPVAKSRAVPFTWNDNVCTVSYSYVWYDEAAWMAHIDWMALQGVNVFLALTGQEEIQYKAFLRFGLKDRDIREFFNGPAYLTWSRGQNMQSVGSSAMPEGGDAGLPRSWMQSQWRLQKQILNRTRSLGIIGVLPAFQGNMPPQIRSLYPSANITVTGKNENVTKGSCAWVASTDPLFAKVADAWMQELLADFGTDHWYQADGLFMGGNVPWEEAERATVATSPVPADKIVADPNWKPLWEAAWRGIANTDPLAKWVYQGWQIRSWGSAEDMSRLKALFDVVPYGQWIVVDMDQYGIWRHTNWMTSNHSLLPFFGAPFIWTTLMNMGGNDGMKGVVKELMALPGMALNDSGANIIGVGATPEGIDQNTAYFAYAYDTAWHATAQPVGPWFAEYSSRRYGLTHNPDAASAWDLLRQTVYDYHPGFHDETGVEWGVMHWGAIGNPPSDVHANVSGIAAAWKLLLQAGSQLNPEKIPTYNHDLVDVGREAIAQAITILERNLTALVNRRDRSGARLIGVKLMDAFADLDELLGCDYGFLLGPWIDDARKWANASDAPAAYFEWQARSQVTTWNPISPSFAAQHKVAHPTPLDGYANKHWNGLVKDFFAKRVQCYVDQIDSEPNATWSATEIALSSRTESAADPKRRRKQPADGGQACVINSTGVAATYIAGFPPSVGPGHNPKMPFNDSDFAAAKDWCCAHDDCGGIMFEFGVYTARAGHKQLPDPSHPCMTWLREPPFPPNPPPGPPSPPPPGPPLPPKPVPSPLNGSNITRCIGMAAVEFTLGSSTQYATQPSGNTLEVSNRLFSKYTWLL